MWDGIYFPIPMVECFPAGKSASNDSSASNELNCLPTASSHPGMKRIGFLCIGLQYCVALLTLSAKYNPWPNIFPVRLTPGRLISSPFESILPIFFRIVP